MRQLSLFAETSFLAGVMPALRAAMRRAAGDEASEGRKLLADKINSLAKQGGVRLGGGNSSELHKDTLDKWLAPGDMAHVPGILALLVFCKATGNVEPLRVLAQALGMELMNEEDRKHRDYGRAALEEKAARKKRMKLEGDMQ